MIDLKNMLPGYSSQQLVAMAGLQTVPEDNTMIRVDVGTALLREEQLIDVGFLLVSAPTEGIFTVSFSVVEVGDAQETNTTVVQDGDTEFTTAYRVDFSDTPVDGQLYRVSDGTLSWTTITARRGTEDERRIARGERVYCCIDDQTQAGASVIPFCILRTNESLDPIA